MLILVEEEGAIVVVFTEVETSQEAEDVEPHAQPLSAAAHEVPSGVTLPAIGCLLIITILLMIRSIATIIRCAAPMLASDALQHLALNRQAI
jgi:hypothetical protein